MSFVVDINKHGNEKSCPFPVEMAVSSVVPHMRRVEKGTLSSSPGHTFCASTLIDLHHDYFRDFDTSDLSIVPQIKKSKPFSKYLNRFLTLFSLLQATHYQMTICYRCSGMQCGRIASQKRRAVYYPCQAVGVPLE